LKYGDLLVWQKAMDLVEVVYRVSRSFPSEERFGPASQLQRSAVSIPSNIAEGHGRKSTKAYVNHLSIASGSLMELETQLHIARRVGYVDDTVLGEITEASGEIGRMLNGLQGSLTSKSRSSNSDS
jgi:four helix bundle protein